MAIFKQRQGKGGGGGKSAKGAKGGSFAKSAKGGGFGGGSRFAQGAQVARSAKGGHGAKGGKAGKGAGNWVFVPAAAPPMRGSVRRFDNGQGHGGKSAPFKGNGGKGHGRKGAAIKGHGGKGRSGKGAAIKGHGGKGHGGKGKPVNKRMDKLGKLDADHKVWVGGLPTEGASWKKLSDHFEDGFLKPSIVEIMSKGSACLAFKSAEEASSAIGALNGSEFEGQSIEVDVWTKKEKKERPEGARPNKSKPVIKHSLKLKKGKKTADSPMAAKIKAVDHSLKLWVGGLSTDTKWKAIKQHFEDNGCEVDLCDLLRKPGTACVAFKTEDEASAAVGSLNGTELEGETLQVDVWTRPERREKKAKED